MLPLNTYLSSLRSRLKAPTLSKKEAQAVMGRVTGIMLNENEFEISRGTIRILSRPEKRIAILAARNDILEVFQEEGIRVEKIV